MDRPSSASDPERQIGIFELQRLRRTDLFADPVVRARALCCEVAELLNIDRVSFLITQTSPPQLIATSTTVDLDERSREVIRLQELAAGAGEDSELAKSDHEHASPQCVDEFVAPIRVNGNDDVCAVVVLQRFAPQSKSLADTITPVLPQLEAASAEIATAWAASPHPSSGSLSRRWKQLGRGKRAALAALVAIAVACLLLIPVPFRIPVEGRIEPAISRGVFAPVSGTMIEMAVADGESIRAGDLLATLSSADVQLQYERLAGELASAETELATLRLNQSDSGNATGSDLRNGSNAFDPRNRSARQVVLRTRIESLREQHALISDVKESLAIRSPINGRVTMRDEQAELQGQNVRQGQWLMQVVDLSGGFHAVVDVPDDNVGYLDAAISDDSPIHASFRLRSSPDREFEAAFLSAANTITPNQHGNPVLEIRMRVLGELTADVHLGATVTGELPVGKRAFGFVLFRPLVELLRSYGW
ncbi:MAG: efflux RND transporter periplasmic adaptor subunit [Rhodopirellula sp. JB044]|uniref:efflux RND transporter periplasmic adaptor subunit n=1 Tax=Rhodopirellula sp. JB044 TaxID=3342844 RepID=UPI00370B8B1C